MSRVMLIAADKPLPLCDKREERTAAVHGSTISYEGGFRVSEHAYYRPAVDGLGHEIKPFQYELELEEQNSDLKHLRDYLREHFTCGEVVELWNLWVGDDPEDRPVRYAGNLADFDMDTLKQFLKPMLNNGVIGQCRMTITI